MRSRIDRYRDLALPDQHEERLGVAPIGRVVRRGEPELILGLEHLGRPQALLKVFALFSKFNFQEADGSTSNLLLGTFTFY